MKHINRFADWLYGQPSTEDDRITPARAFWTAVFCLSMTAAYSLAAHIAGEGI